MSIRTVARDLHVSPATVSLALKGDARVSALTRARVLEHCRRTGYTPSFSARSLSVGRSFTLHVVHVTDDGGVGRFLSDFLEGAARAAGARGYRLTLSVIRDDQWEHLHAHLRDGSADGFVLLNPREAEEYALFREAGAPLLVVGRSGCADTARVDTDNQAVGHDLALHLRAQGYARPVLLGAAARTFTHDRLRGLRRLYPDAPLLGTCGVPQEVMALTEQALTAGHDALIATDDALLPALLKTLKRLGRAVPEVGVAGMGNDLSAYLDPEVTSIDFDAPRLGAAAASHLLDQLDAPETPAPLLFVPHRLVARESTRR